VLLVACDIAVLVIILNGRAVRSCAMFAIQVDGKKIDTVEGLGTDDNLHAVQRGFMEEDGMQCGFCTPRMIMTVVAFLRTNPDPTEKENQRAISGNLCRCTDYVNKCNSERREEIERTEGRRKETHCRCSLPRLKKNFSFLFDALAPEPFAERLDIRLFRKLRSHFQ
jgi:aerobic-type carbon monoxide dehydrogenase small subunit (CoxS/CutS family)